MGPESKGMRLTVLTFPRPVAILPHEPTCLIVGRIEAKTRMTAEQIEKEPLTIDEGSGVELGRD